MYDVSLFRRMILEILYSKKYVTTWKNFLYDKSSILHDPH